MFSLWRKLKEAGVLGINGRNAQYVLRYNSRKLYPLVDDKLATKQLAINAGIAVPELYAKIANRHDIRNLQEVLKDKNDFVIKPAYGVGGDGIIVITNTMDGHYRKASGSLLTIDDLTYHIDNILSGIHSLSGQPDTAIIEYCVKPDPVFASMSYQGVPDIRIITLFGYPVMAMVRLPTRMSDGKANLHQGAIGVGIDLATGTTFGGVWHNNTIDYHPDTLTAIRDCQIPDWDKILELASQCYDMTGLGYIGVDIVIDYQHGPLVLELNARPGLNIQIANRCGLGKRLSYIEAHADKEASVADKIAFVKKCFS